MHKRSEAYSSLLSKHRLFSMAWRAFKMLLTTWQACSKQILIWGFQKCRTCTCFSGDTKVAGCKTFLFFKNYIFTFMYHIVIWKQRHLWTLFFQALKLWQPVTLQPLEAQGHVLHFWKSPIYICLNPDCQGDCSVLNVFQVMLKSWGLLNKLLYASDLLCTTL